MTSTGGRFVTFNQWLFYGDLKGRKELQINLLCTVLRNSKFQNKRKAIGHTVTTVSRIVVLYSGNKMLLRRSTDRRTVQWKQNTVTTVS